MTGETEKKNDRQRLKKIRVPSVQGGGVALRFAAFIAERGQGNLNAPGLMINFRVILGTPVISIIISITPSLATKQTIILVH